MLLRALGLRFILDSHVIFYVDIQLWLVFRFA